MENSIPSSTPSHFIQNFNVESNESPKDGRMKASQKQLSEDAHVSTFCSWTHRNKQKPQLTKSSNKLYLHDLMATDTYKSEKLETNLPANAAEPVIEQTQENFSDSGGDFIDFVISVSGLGKTTTNNDSSMNSEEVIAESLSATNITLNGELKTTSMEDFESKTLNLVSNASLMIDESHVIDAAQNSLIPVHSKYPSKSDEMTNTQKAVLSYVQRIQLESGKDRKKNRPQPNPRDTNKSTVKYPRIPIPICNAPDVTGNQTISKMPVSATSNDFNHISSPMSNQVVQLSSYSIQESVMAFAQKIKQDSEKNKARKQRLIKGPPQKRYFEKKDVDVIFGRGTGPNKHNALFREQVAISQDAYLNAHDAEKKAIVDELICWVRNRGGRFLDRDSYGWYEVTEKAISTKVRQNIREAKSRQDRKAIQLPEKRKHDSLDEESVSSRASSKEAKWES
jgi:hypothetical protein